jgi:hypothetical protein
MPVEAAFAACRRDSQVATWPGQGISIVNDYED